MLSARYMLTQNPEVEAKVVAELDRLELLVTKDRPQPRQMTYTDLSKLEYLQAVVKVCPQKDTILAQYMECSVTYAVTCQPHQGPDRVGHCWKV